jgi:hypothetical protein
MKKLTTKQMQSIKGAADYAFCERRCTRVYNWCIANGGTFADCSWEYTDCMSICLYP